MNRQRSTAVISSPIGLLLIGLLLIGVAALAWFLLPQLRCPGCDPDVAAINGERAHRLAVFKRGDALSGTPDFANLPARLADFGASAGAPVFIRIFKREFELEVWLRKGDRFQLFATHPICRFSGDLGPKLVEGDGQSPEGFYTVDQRAMNPASRWHRSFNLGFPNVLDRAQGRTGSLLMVHGGCSSVGCYAMTNPGIDEIWRLVQGAHRAGQRPCTCTYSRSA